MDTKGEPFRTRPPWWKRPLGASALVVLGVVGTAVFAVLSDQWDWIAAGMPDPPEVPSVLPPDPAPGHEAWGVEWVSLPEGSFEMGGDEAQPVHTVTVPPFQLTRTEVTVAMYRACVEAKRCAPPAQEGRCTYYVDGADQHPVNCVPWEQARIFCSAAGGRLPTEAEWEYAATGVERRRFANHGFHQPSTFSSTCCQRIRLSVSEAGYALGSRAPPAPTFGHGPLTQTPPITLHRLCFVQCSEDARRSELASLLVHAMRAKAHQPAQN